MAQKHTDKPTTFHTAIPQLNQLQMQRNYVQCMHTYPLPHNPSLCISTYNLTTNIHFQRSPTHRTLSKDTCIYHEGPIPTNHMAVGSRGGAQ